MIYDNSKNKCTFYPTLMKASTSIRGAISKYRLDQETSDGDDYKIHSSSGVIKIGSLGSGSIKFREYLKSNGVKYSRDWDIGG